MDKIETKIVSVQLDMDKEDIFTEDFSLFEEAGRILREGGLVAFPTETVYGIGANALDIEAIQKIYEAKGRPSDNPLIMHISRLSDVKKYAKEVNEKALLLIEAFWPGPLTLVFQKDEIVPKQITGGLETVAIRMPNHPIARRLIDAAKVPIAAPSANLSGKPSPTRGRHVIEDLAGRVDMIIDGGKTEHGLESTVLDVTSDIPCILRPGSITKAMIEEVIGEVRYDEHLSDASNVPRAPGMKYKHYAPEGQLTIVSGASEAGVIAYINEMVVMDREQGKKVGVIVPQHVVGRLQGDVVENIGDVDNPKEIGANLFKLLRKMDELKVDKIYSFDYKGEEIGLAIMNRLIKAAGNRVVELE